MPRKKKEQVEFTPDPCSSDIGCPPYSDEQREFLQAMECYKKEHRRLFPTCCEVLAVLKSLGYRKVADPTEIPRFGTGKRRI